MIYSKLRDTQVQLIARNSRRVVIYSDKAAALVGQTSRIAAAALGGLAGAPRADPLRVVLSLLLPVHHLFLILPFSPPIRLSISPPLSPHNRPEPQPAGVTDSAEWLDRTLYKR
jgi:hypothetical protein